MKVSKTTVAKAKAEGKTRIVRITQKKGMPVKQKVNVVTTKTKKKYS